MAWNVLGKPFPAAFWIAVAFPVVHQVFVWQAWRLELNSKGTSRTIGFRGYLALFFLLFGGRFVSLLTLAWMDRGSLHLPILPRAVAPAFNSAAALTVAAFSHAYIWVHYFATEKPDMDFLYGRP